MRIILLFIVIIFGNCHKSNIEKVEETRKPYPPEYLCIYYGYPSLVNNVRGDLKKAVEEFSKFNLIVLGDGLWKNNHPDNTNTKKIIDGLIQNRCLVFGYIDLGVSTNNYAIETLKQYIDGWKVMGVSGIFFDDAGYDYKVTRERQNEVIKHCKILNLKVFMNAWNPDDVLSNPTLMDNNDIYLAESFLVGHDKYLSITDWKSKADKCLDYSKKIGVKIACVTTGGETIVSDFNKSLKYSLAWVGTAMYNFDYFQATNYFYSSNNNIVYYFPNHYANYGNKWKTSVIKKTDGNYYRESDKNIFNIYGNGNDQGYGEIK